MCKWRDYTVQCPLYFSQWFLWWRAEWFRFSHLNGSLWAESFEVDLLVITFFAFFWAKRQCQITSLRSSLANSPFSYSPPSNVSALIISHTKTFMYILWSKTTSHQSIKIDSATPSDSYLQLLNITDFHPSKRSGENQCKHPEVLDERTGKYIFVLDFLRTFQLVCIIHISYIIIMYNFQRSSLAWDSWLQGLVNSQHSAFVISTFVL